MDPFVFQVCNTTVKIIVNQEIQEEDIPPLSSYWVCHWPAPTNWWEHGPHQLVEAHTSTRWWGPITHEQEAEPT
jgi:hypothetical protein